MAEPSAGIDERARLSRGAAGAVQEFSKRCKTCLANR
jgi:hypothetical protein